MTDLTLVVVAKDWDTLREFKLAHIDAAELVLIANTTSESLASIGNRYLRNAKTRVVGLAHADCIFEAGSLKAFSDTAMAGAVCGIVGIADDTRYCWCFNGRQAVQTLDSCSIFLDRRMGLEFDAVRFDSFHCHVQDVCLEARRRGIPVIVPQADATHVGLNYAEPAWRDQYDIYKSRLRKKWGNEVLCT